MDTKTKDETFFYLTGSENATDNTSLFSKKFSKNETFKSSSIALVDISFSNEIYNVSAILSNNYLSYIWVDGVEYYIRFFDGKYSTSDLIRYIHGVMYENKHYIFNQITGEYIYFINLLQDNTYNSIDIVLDPVPSDINLPSFFQKPVGSTWTGIGNTLQLNIISKINKSLGYQLGLYPTVLSNTQQIFYSSFAPKLLNTFSPIIVNCNLCDNFRFSPNNPYVLYIIKNSGTTEGRNESIIQEIAHIPVFNKIQEIKIFESIDISLLCFDLDENMINLPLTNTNNFYIKLLLRESL
jgi:hypothetical protein